MTDTALDRTRFVKALLAARGTELVVAGIGLACSDVRAAGETPLNFYVFGAMGAAASVGLGLAIAQPDRRVLVVTGDGELMMNIGALATVALQQPKNLSIVVLDNERLGATGFQKSHSAFGVDIEAIARGCGIRSTLTVRTENQVPALVERARREDGPFFGLAKVAPVTNGLPAGLIDGVEQKLRFRRALLGTA